MAAFLPLPDHPGGFVNQDDGIFQVTEDDEIMILTSAGMIIRMKTKDISIIGRNTQGVKLINIADDDKVVGVVKLAEREDSDVV